MALKDKWIEKVDRVDIASAGDINLVAQAVIELEENGGTKDELDLKANAADVYTKSETDAKVSAVTYWGGNVSSVSQLPSSPKAGTYCYVTADISNGVKYTGRVGDLFSCDGGDLWSYTLMFTPPSKCVYTEPDVTVNPSYTFIYNESGTRLGSISIDPTEMPGAFDASLLGVTSADDTVTFYLGVHNNGTFPAQIYNFKAGEMIFWNGSMWCAVPPSSAIEEIDSTLNLKADKASTLSGYGITDAYAKDEVDAKDNAIKNDIIEEQKDNADSYVSSLNLFDYYSPYNVNGYINGKGSISSNATYKTSHFIKVEPNTTYYVLGFYKSSEYGYNFAPFLCEYSEDKTVVLFSTDVVNSFTTQSNTKYVRFSYRATSAYNRVGLSKVPFENSLAKPYNPMIIETKINKNSNMKRYYVSDYSDLGASSSLDVVSYATSIRKNERLIFSGDITTFNGIEIGLARDVDGTTYNRLEITSEKVIAYNYNGTSTEYTHGLTIENNIQIICEVGFSFNLNLTLVSNGESFTQTNIRWERKYECYPYAKSLSSVMTNCRLSWTCTDFNKDIWMFGDSYFGYTDKWTYYFNKYGYADNVLMDSYGGKGSKDAITSLKTYLKIAKPKIVVWCMGMNDGSDSDDAPSTPWLESVEELLNLSNIYDFKVVLSTIPSVPNINHEAKNAYVRSSNVYEKIDFARAVGATSDGTWYGDMLSSDNVHPSAKGALALFMRAVQDAPFLMISSN